jgi:hypothetical protein
MEPNATSSGSLYPDQERQVMAAWDRFLRGAELPPDAIRSVIESSWSRCLSGRVDPERSRAQPPAPEEDLRRLQHRHRDLIDASVPVMQQARDFLSESGTMMILTDPTGAILETEGDQATLDAAEDVRLVSGRTGTSSPAARMPSVPPCLSGSRYKSTRPSISAPESSRGPVPRPLCEIPLPARSSARWTCPG